MAKGSPSYGRKKRPDRARGRGDKAREWCENRPKQAYRTAVESRSERPDDVIGFTMRRLPSAD